MGLPRSSRVFFWTPRGRVMSMDIENIIFGVELSNFIFAPTAPRRRKRRRRQQQQQQPGVATRPPSPAQGDRIIRSDPPHSE